MGNPAQQAVGGSLIIGGSILNGMGYYQGAKAMRRAAEPEAERQEAYEDERRSSVQDILRSADIGRLAQRMGTIAAGSKKAAGKVGKAYAKAGGKAGADARRSHDRLQKRADNRAEADALPVARQQLGTEMGAAGNKIRRTDVLAELSRRANQAEIQAASHTGSELRMLGQMANMMGQAILANGAYGG